MTVYSTAQRLYKKGKLENALRDTEKIEIPVLFWHVKNVDNINTGKNRRFDHCMKIHN